MHSPISIPIKDWRAFIHELEDAFGVQLPHSKGAEVDVEAVFQTATQLVPEPAKQGQIVIRHELQHTLASILAISPSDITGTTKMTTLVTGSQRKQVMAQLQRDLEWKLPRLGMPVWAQYIWGAGLLIGFVLQFIYPLWGMLLFWGGMLMSFQVEKMAWSFQFTTFGQWVDRCVQLNWPAIELGAVDSDRLRIVFAELLRQHWPSEFDPRMEFPKVIIVDPFQGLGAQWHILNGDALRLILESSEFPGEHIVMRECMVVGPVDPLPNFFELRAKFIAANYDAPVEKYQQWVMAELQKLATIPLEADINLWFEDDLFCQVNLWFLIDQLLTLGRSEKIYRVMPHPKTDSNPWEGFAGLDSQDLAPTFHQRVLLIDRDLQFASALWQAYQSNDLAQLKRLSNTSAPQWRGLSEVVNAHLDRQPDESGLGAPERILKAILAEGKTEFNENFAAFNEQAGIYGFGDLQVKAMIAKLS